ncbi:Sulfotransferase [Handroanthus impetiginosus]|uniref:Sulfotransferase n=1 Tax=Handroanthus impetiginosus TaxID=429701 RepID=A0A2G9HVM8_9LAMI|nr:Sulfotransferase [Handroanthus impetiginosus]
MPNTSPSPTPIPTPNNVEKSLNDLPRARFWEAMDICQWEGYWFEPGLVKPAITFRSTFHARNDDILLASTIKTGTTWLKSLSLCITQNRQNHKHNDILTTENPHFHVPTIESMIYSTKPTKIDIYDASSPRLLHTHLPYSVLPVSVKESQCKIVYIARNPKDTIISMWHFFNSIFRPNQDPFPLEKAVDCFCSGVHQYGSFFEHVVEYWLESQKRPEKMLFLKYEEMKRDPKGEVSKIAEFLGRPFGDGEVDEILWRCSLDRLKNLEVNKNGSILYNVPNSSYFRKGEVGDWKKYLTPEMEERINQTSRSKLEAFGLFL